MPAQAMGIMQLFYWTVQDCIDAGQLSNAQIEAVVYAFMRFEKRLQNGESCLQNMVVTE